jgi:integrase
MRRGELLALRWRDIDLERGIIAVRRSAGIVRLKGQPAVIRESDTKSMQSGTAAEARGQPVCRSHQGGVRWPQVSGKYRQSAMIMVSML